MGGVCCQTTIAVCSGGASVSKTYTTINIIILLILVSAGTDEAFPAEPASIKIFSKPAFLWLEWQRRVPAEDVAKQVLTISSEQIKIIHLMQSSQQSIKLGGEYPSSMTDLLGKMVAVQLTIILKNGQNRTAESHFRFPEGNLILLGYFLSRREWQCLP